MSSCLLKFIQRHPRLRFHFQQAHYRIFLRKNHSIPFQLSMGCGAWEEDFCADPFLFSYRGDNYLFYECLSSFNAERLRGCIGCFKEEFGVWHNLGLVLNEPFHLSYPHIIQYDGIVYMIPESCQNNAVMLYEAIDFPNQWRVHSKLITGRYVDSSLLQWKDGWYIVTAPENISSPPELFYANSLFGPWQRHLQSFNVNASLSTRRNGGNFLVEDGNVFRIAQDCDDAYGKRIFKVPILKLSPTEYEEGRPIPLFPANSDWPNAGLHHTYNRMSCGGITYEVIDSHFYTLHSVSRCLSECWKGVKNCTKKNFRGISSK